MKRDITVYVASCWWRDSDPHTSVAALTAEECEQAIERAMQDAAEMESDGEYCVCGSLFVDEDSEDEHEACGLDRQAWSGVFPESLRATVTDIDNMRDVIADLRVDGIAYLETV